MNLSDTHTQMVIDFTASVLTGGALALAQYLLGDQAIDWRPLGAAVLVGMIAASRKWVQAKLVEPPAPPIVVSPHG